MLEHTPEQWLQEVIKNCLNTLPMTEKKETLITDKELKNRYEQFTYKEKACIRSLFREQFETNDSLLILSYLVNIVKLDDFCQDIAYHISVSEFDCFTQSMLEIQLIFFGNIPYPQMRKVHRKSIACFSKELDCRFPYIPIEKRNKNRIVILTEQLLHNRHAPTAMTLQTAYVLQKKLGYEILLMTCTSNRPISPGLWISTKGFNAADERGYKKLDYQGETLSLYQYPMKLCTLEDYRQMLSQIYDWNPLFVLNMGINNPIADLPQTFTTVAERAMVTTAPISEADILIRNVRQSEELEAEYETELSPHQKQIFMDRKFPAIIEKSEKTYTRREFNLPENKFLIAVVGNRLNSEIDERFIQLMYDILQSNDQIDIVIIGSADDIWNQLNNEMRENRIHYPGYCRDLFAVYRIVDLYLNPKRQGGGWSSTIALKAGLPVVTLPECDVAHSVGETFIVPDYQNMLHTILRYSTDTAFYKKQQQSAFQLAAGNDDDKIVDYVSELMTKIQEAMKND